MFYISSSAIEGEDDNLNNPPFYIIIGRGNDIQDLLAAVDRDRQDEEPRGPSSPAANLDSSLIEGKINYNCSGTF